MSITFSYSDGAPSRSSSTCSSTATRPYAWLLYSRLGDLYVDKQRYQDAATTYRAFVARDPYSDHAPDLDMAAIEAYGKGGFSELVLDGKHEFVERYNFDSPFWKTRSRADNPQVVQELKINLKDVATYYHATAQKTKRVADYQEAARWYRDYLKSFPDDPDSAATNYLLAEALFESHQYGEAAAEYEHTAYDYPKNAKSATAAYAALVSYQKGEEGLTGADEGRLAQARHRCRREVRADLPRAPGQRRRADARGRGDVRRRRPAARHQRVAVDAGAPAAGRCRQAAHRLDHHRPVALRPGRVRQGRAGLHAGARPAPAPTRRCAPTSPSAWRRASTSRARRSRRPGDAGGRGRGLPARRARRARTPRSAPTRSTTRPRS